MADKIFKDSQVGDVVLRKSAKARRVSLRVHPERGVSVVVPRWASYDVGLRFFRSRREWVLAMMAKQQARMRGIRESDSMLQRLGDGVRVSSLVSSIVFTRIPQRTFADGLVSQLGSTVSQRTFADDSTLLYVNVKSEVLAQPIMLDDDSGDVRHFLSFDFPLIRRNVVYYSDASAEGSEGLDSSLRAILVEVLRRDAKLVLPKKVEKFAQRFGLDYSRVTIKHNVSNWGSCSTKRNINLNLNLIRVPEILCDYVILHELAHLRYHDHSAKFHTLLEEFCRDLLERRLQMAPKEAHLLTSWPDTSLTTSSGAALNAVSKASSSVASTADPYLEQLIAKIKTSRSQWPIHITMSQELKKYKLL